MEAMNGKIDESFSFLYRNERTATLGDAGIVLTVATFQFPLSERTNCNYGTEFG